MVFCFCCPDGEHLWNLQLYPALHLSTAVNTMFFFDARVTVPNKSIKKPRIGRGEEMKHAQLSCSLISHTWSSTNKLKLHVEEMESLEGYGKVDERGMIEVVGHIIYLCMHTLCLLLMLQLSFICH